ncbi:MAG: O-antigen polymerase [Bacteroidota bacterium]
MILVLLYLATIIISFYKFKSKIIPYIPLFVTLVEILPFYFNIQNNEIILLKYLNTISVFAVFMIYIYKNLSVFFKITTLKIIVVFILLMFYAISNSTDQYFSLKIVMNFATVLLSFPVGFIYFKKEQTEIKTFFNILLICLVLYIVNIVLCSFLKLGESTLSYSDQSIVYLGALNFFSLYPICYLLIACLLYFSKIKKSKVFIFFVTLIVFLIFFYIGKRTYIYLSLFGFLALFYNSRKVFINFSALVLLLIFLIPSISQTITNQFFTARSSQLDRSITEEGRYLELIAYKDEVLNIGSTNEIIFGKEIFNSQAKFFQNSNIIDDDNRVLHSDFSNILFGTGILGFLIYLTIQLSLILNIRYIRKFKMNNPNYKLLHLVYITVLIALIINSTSDGILAFPNRFFPYFILGATLGMINHKTAKKPTLEKPDESI